MWQYYWNKSLNPNTKERQSTVHSRDIQVIMWKRMSKQMISPIRSFLIINYRPVSFELILFICLLLFPFQVIWIISDIVVFSLPIYFLFPVDSAEGRLSLFGTRERREEKKKAK